MPNYVLLTFLGANFLFLGSGVLILVVSLMFRTSTLTINNVGASLLLQISPLNAGLANAVFIFLTAILAIPGILFEEQRLWLRAHSWMALLSAVISLGVGLEIWFLTLQTRANLSQAWGSFPTSQQSTLQQAFQCCGYFNAANPPFITDGTCTDLQTAQKLGGCVTPFSNFANSFLDVVFTAMFGAVGLDCILFLTSIVLLKDRSEKARYRLIDRKYGSAAL